MAVVADPVLFGHDLVLLVDDETLEAATCSAHELAASSALMDPIEQQGLELDMAQFTLLGLVPLVNALIDDLLEEHKLSNYYHGPRNHKKRTKRTKE